MTIRSTLTRLFGLSVLMSLGLISQAQANKAETPEQAITRSIAENIKDFPKIDRIVKTPAAGIYEVQFGNELIYATADGEYLFQGQLLQAKGRRNLTGESQAALNAIDFKSLPQQDAFKIVRGKGERQMAVFVDPNCGFCKRYEADLKKLDNVTISVFLFPVLGADSITKSKNIWCAANREKTWEEWMLNGVPPPTAQATCDTVAIDRNVAFGRDKRINGTPATIFADGKRLPGAMPLDTVEKALNAATPK